MTKANVTPLRPVRKLISFFPDSDLTCLVREGYALAQVEPRILEMIDHDRDAYALVKKKERMDDQDWLLSRGVPLSGFDEEGDSGEWEVGSELLTGRPRMLSELVLVFILIRGYLGGFKDKKTAMLLLESRTLETLFSNLGLNLPGFSTILDNINPVTPGTLEEILDVQIREARKQKLDNFKNLTTDSTDVAANSSWPTDSGTLAGLSFRAEHLLRGLVDFGITLNLPVLVQKFIAELDVLHKQIQLTSGKKDSAAKRKKFYRKMFKLATKVHQMLTLVLQRGVLKAASLDLMPSLKTRLTTRLDWIAVDLQNLTVAIQNAKARILQNKKVAAEEKIVSLSDEDAAMIVKGGREPVLGYKPQIVRSRTGLVTAIVLPEGNAADSGQLRGVVDLAIKRTGVKPSVLSFDDGYTNQEDRDYYLGLGIAVVSFSGSKGKRLISEEDYDSKAYAKARNDRSAVESTIFTLKHNHDFDRVMRRGIDNVRNELLEKVIAHNFFRLIALKRTLQRKLLAA